MDQNSEGLSDIINQHSFYKQMHDMTIDEFSIQLRVCCDWNDKYRNIVCDRDKVNSMFSKQENETITSLLLSSSEDDWLIAHEIIKSKIQ